MFPEDLEIPARPMPGFRPLSRQSSVATRDRAEIQTRNEFDTMSLKDLIKKNFGHKKKKPTEDEEPQNGEDDDAVDGDENFENAGVSADFFNVFKGFDEDDMIEEGFENTNQYLKSEFNEPAPRRFGTRVKKSTPRWNQEETDFFFQVLAMCGTDFSMMSKFFPKRTRKMIVNKFHCEEKKNPIKIKEAICNPVPLDLSLYATSVGIDEGSIITDYQKNREKLTTRAPIPSQTRKNDSENSNSDDGWEDANEEKEQDLEESDKAELKDADEKSDDSVNDDGFDAF